MTESTEKLRGENEALRKEVLRLRGLLGRLERRGARRVPESNEGLADEGYFLRRLREAVLAAERYARFLSVIMIDLPSDEDLDKGRAERVLAAATLFAGVFRKSDVVALFESDRIYVLLEETESSQGVEALRRVQDEIGFDLAPRYSMACYPNDAQRDTDLLQILEERMSKVCLFSTSGPAVNMGEEVLSLMN